MLRSWRALRSHGIALWSLPWRLLLRMLCRKILRRCVMCGRTRGTPHPGFPSFCVWCGLAFDLGMGRARLLVLLREGRANRLQ